MSPALLVQQRPSPNHNARPFGRGVSCVVLHADASPRVSASIVWLQDRASRVSYHYLIGRRGDVYQLVDEERRAWHAGTSTFDGLPDVNSFSIGIAFSNRNDGVEPYPEEQLSAAATLICQLMRRHPAVVLSRITTHRAIAVPAGRKTDPAPPFELAPFIERVRAASGCCASPATAHSSTST